MKYTALILSLLIATITQAQNHVPNGDFEYYSVCPIGYSQVPSCLGWDNFVTGPTPDFFHTCATSNNVSVPLNWFGFQNPASGNGYFGGYFYIPNSANYREIVTRKIVPLTIGVTYEVSLSVCRSGRGGRATDNITILFFDTLGNITPSNWQTLQPQVHFQNYGIITDTLNWVRLTSTFTADSTYDNIAIGGFLPDSLINVDTTNVASFAWAYYYFDSVVVKPIWEINISNHLTNFCVNDSFIINFNTSFKLNTNNIFTAQLSDATGNFINPTTIGSLTSDTTGTIRGYIPNSVITGSGYKVRLISSSPKDTIISNQLIKIGNLDSTNTSVQVTSNSPVCVGKALSFTNTSTPNYLTYSWTGPIGYTSSLPSPYISSVLLANAGSYYLTSNLYGCEILDTLQVQVNPLPNKPIASSNTPVCQYDTLALTAASTTSGVTYSWIGPNSYTNNTQNPIRVNVPQTAGGFYTVAATLNGCSTYDTIAVTIKDVPDTVTLSSNSPLCTDDTLKLFSDTSTGNVTYAWSGPNSFSASANDTIIANASVANTGWYSMTVNLNGCTYSDSTYVMVTQTPSAPTLSYNNPLCIGEQLNLNATSLVSGVSYSWTGPNNFNSTIKNPTKTNVQLADTGNYYATVTYNNCTSPVSSLNINIKPNPFVVISTPFDTVCDGTNVTYMAIPVNASSNLQYTWKINAQPQSATGSTFSTTNLNNNDIILCEMTDNAQCSSPVTDQSNQIKMNVLPWLAPSVSIAANPTGIIIPWDYVQFTATPVNAGNNPQYQWKRNGQDIIGATSNIWSANNLNDNDTIHVELISSYKCPQPTAAKSNSIVVRIATGINEIKEDNQLTLAPNPNNGQFTLSGQLNTKGVAKIQIINMLGQIVYNTETRINNGTLNHQIKIDQATSGLYLLQLSIDNQLTQIKFRID
ncbi:MAG: T9SS type A sorting domain-containing protein [Flavipsychrobacter sp.]